MTSCASLGQFEKVFPKVVITNCQWVIHVYVPKFFPFGAGRFCPHVCMYKYIRKFCTLFKSVLENEEVECDEKNALKNLITSQKLLPEHFTSMNLENGVFSAQPDKRSSQFVTGSGSSYGDVNNINLRLAMNECHPQQQVRNS